MPDTTTTLYVLVPWLVGLGFVSVFYGMKWIDSWREDRIVRRRLRSWSRYMQRNSQPFHESKRPRG
jgi:hypothetical protein